MVDDRVRCVRAELEPVEDAVATGRGKCREERLPGAGRVQRHAVAGLREEPHDLGAGDRLDVHRCKVVKDDEIGRLARRLGDRPKDRSSAKAELAEARTAFGKGRELRAGVVPTRLGVLANIATTEQRR